MSGPIKYIGSVGEKFGSNFNEGVVTNEQVNVYNLANSGLYNSNYSLNINSGVPNNINTNKAYGMFNALQSKLNTGNVTQVYGLDIETIGNVLDGSTELEKELASITEFAMNKMKVQRVNGAFNVLESNSVMNFTFGINSSQKDALMKLRKKIASGEVLTSTEMATADNILRYSGVRLKDNPKNDFFKKVDGLWTIQKHNTGYKPLDIDLMLTGIQNLEYIGKNQGIGTNKGNKIISNIKSTFKSMRESGDTLITYNGENFDIPFTQRFFKSIGVEDVFDGVDHFDSFLVNDTTNRFNLLENSVKANKTHNIPIAAKKMGTNIEQAKIRGINIEDTAHMGAVDIEATLLSLFQSNTSVNPMFVDIENNIGNIKTNTFDTGKKDVLYSNKAIKMSNKSNPNATIRNGVLDQFIENGETIGYYGYSTNLGNYYGVKNSGFIPKEVLSNEVKEMLSDEAEGLYFLNLRNKSNEVDRESLIFRESLDDLAVDLQSHFTIQSNVSQETIDYKTRLGLKDSTRRRIEANRSAKGYRGYKDISKDNALLNLLKENVQTITGNNNYISPSDMKYVVQSAFDGEKFDFSKIGNTNLSLDVDYINSKLGHYYSPKDINSFVSRVGRISDEYELNSMILSYLDEALDTRKLNLNTVNSNIVNRNNKILEAYKTDAYDYILSSLEDEALYKELENLQKSTDETISPAQIKEIERNIKGYGTLPYTESDSTKIDILKNTEQYLMDKNGVMDLDDLVGTDKYTRVDTSNIENLSKSIYNNAMFNITKDMPIRNIDRKDMQRQYIYDLAYDLQRRGIIDKESLRIIESTDDLYSASNFIAVKLHKAVNSKTGNLLESQINDIILESHAPGGVDFSNYIFNTIGGSSAIGKDITNLNIAAIGNRYVDSLPTAFSISTLEDFNKNKNLISWFKDLGYTDKNIETLGKSLLKSKESILRNGLSTHFFMENINGVETPMMALAKEDANVLSDIMRGKRPNNASVIMLPKVINPSTDQSVNGVASANSKNRVVKIGNMQKSIVSNLEPYYDGNKLRMSENDTIDSIFKYLNINREELIALINNGEYKEAARRINNFSSKVQMDEIGTSSRITTYGKNGELDLMYVPRISDFELSSKYYSDDLAKYLPFLHEYARDNPNGNKTINNLMSNYYKTFGEYYDKDDVVKNLERMKENVVSNRNYSFSNMTPDVQEWIRVNANKEGGFLEAIREYTSIIGDEYGYSVVNKLLDGEHHSITKDSHGERLIISKDKGVKGLAGSHLTNPTRPLLAQIEGSIPFLKDELLQPRVLSNMATSFGYDDVLDMDRIIENPEFIRDELVGELNNRGVRINPTITTDYVDDYVNVMKNYGFNVSTGVTANLKQINPKTYLTELNSIESNKDIARNYLKRINQRTNRSFTIDEFEEVFKVFRANFSTYEQGGMLNPRMGFLYNKPQIFVQEVGQEFYDKIAPIFKGSRGNLPTLSKGTRLGENNGKHFVFDDIASSIVGVEPLDNAVNNKYKIRYIHNNSNLSGSVKLFAAHSEKGVFSIPKVNSNLSPLLYGLYDELFGEDTFAVSSFEIFKHQGFGGIVNSYLSTMFEEYDKFGKGEDFANTLNSYLPNYNFGVITNDDNTRSLIYNSSPKSSEGIEHIQDVIKNLKTNLSSSTDEADISVYNKIMQMERDGIIRTEFNLAPLEEGMGNEVKFEKRMQQMFDIVEDIKSYELFGEDSEKVSNAIKSLYHNNLVSSKSYREGQKMLLNIKSTANILNGQDGGIVKRINIDDIRLPSSMASFDEIVKSSIFDFGQVNENNAPINVLGIDMPGGYKVRNPLNDNMNLDTLYIPLTRPFKYENDYMLSSMQKNIASLVIDMQQFEEAVKSRDVSEINRLNKSIEDKYSKLIYSFSDELTDKDGIMNLLMKTARIENGGFVLGRKIVEPILDENGYFLDKAGKNMAKMTESGMRYYDVLEVSEDALKNMNVDFENVGKQIYSNRGGHTNFVNKIGNERLNNIGVMENNLRNAEEILRSHKKGLNVLDKTEYKNLIESSKSLRSRISKEYEEVGKSFFELEGIFGITQRYPLIKSESVNVAKIFLNRSFEGNTVMAGPHTAVKMKFDIDADQLAIILDSLIDKDKNVVIKNEDDYISSVFNKIYNIQADRNSDINNPGSVVNIVDKHLKDIEDGKYITGGDYLEQFKIFMKENFGDDETILDFDNFFENEYYSDLTMKTISSKANIGYVSNQNYMLRELANYYYKDTDEATLRAKNLITNFTDAMEQNIFNQKHLTKGQTSLIEGNLYKNLLNTLMHSTDEEELTNSLSGLIDIVNSKGVYDTIDLENVLNKNITNEGEEVISAIYGMVTDENIRNTRNDPLFWKQYLRTDKEKAENIIKLFNVSESEYPKGSQLDDSYNILSNLNDYEYINLDEKIGVGSYIQSEGYDPYKIVEMDKSQRGYNYITLENKFGEQYNLLGDSYDDISNQLKDLGFKNVALDVVDEMYDDTSILSRIFSSQDDMIRELTYLNVIGDINPNQKLVDNKKLNSKLDDVANSLNLENSSITKLKKSLLNIDKETIAKYNNFYNEVYKPQKDLFDEVFTFSQALKQTNAFTEEEILSHSKNLYSSFIVELQNSMNEGVIERAKVVKATKKSFYEKVFSDHQYTSLDEYISKYETKASSEIVGFSNKHYSKPIGYKDLFSFSKDTLNQDISQFDVLLFGNRDVTINNTTKTINEFGIEELVNFVKNKTNDETLIKSQNEVKKYLVDLTRSERNLNNAVYRESDYMLNRLTDAMNDSIRESAKNMSKESTQSLAKTLAKKGFDTIKNHKIATAVLAIGAMGLVSSVTNTTNNSMPPLIDDEKQDVNETNEASFRKSMKSGRVAPPSDNKVYLQRNNGVTYNVKARNRGNISNSGTVNNLKHFFNVGNSASITVNENKDNSQVSDNWLKDKINNLLNF